MQWQGLLQLHQKKSVINQPRYMQLKMLINAILIHPLSENTDNASGTTHTADKKGFCRTICQQCT